MLLHWTYNISQECQYEKAFDASSSMIIHISSVSGRHAYLKQCLTPICMLDQSTSHVSSLPGETLQDWNV